MSPTAGAPGGAPIGLEEQRDLIPPITTRADLKAVEASNIVRAIQWSRGNRRFQATLLSVSGLCRLHREMFRDVWTWAGVIRNHELAPGVASVPCAQIRERLLRLCQEASFWVAVGTFPWPELAIRFHHRLVSIHAFANGNGRHARLAADLLLERHGLASLPWGGGQLVDASARRSEYIAALGEADRFAYQRLIGFAQSR